MRRIGNNTPSAAGKGFTVVTPHQKTVDLGTAVNIHVFDGLVRRHRIP